MQLFIDFESITQMAGIDNIKENYKLEKHWAPIGKNNGYDVS